MTVVVGFAGLGAVVMASDSEATSHDHTRSDESKIWRCHDLLLGYSGNTAVEDPLARAVEAELAAKAPKDRASCIKCIQDAVQPVLERIYGMFVPRPPQGHIPPEIAGHMVVAGKDAEGFWLGHLDESNMFTPASKGLVAIGSGSVAARVADGLLSRYEFAGRNLEDLKLIAHRSVSACITVLGRGYGVGGRVKMWESRPDGSFRELAETEVEYKGLSTSHEERALIVALIGALEKRTVGLTTLRDQMAKSIGKS